MVGGARSQSEESLAGLVLEARVELLQDVHLENLLLYTEFQKRNDILHCASQIT